jgi:ribonucleoside-triphosphate reductase
MSTKRKDVAKAYIKYRELRTKERKWNNDMMRAAREKLTGSRIDNQNANVDEHSFGGRRGEFDSIIAKQYALDNCMSKMARENHLNNEIYIHDLDAYAVGMHNCLSVPFDDLLANGFNTRQTDVRPANSINTAFQLVAVLFQLQSLQQFGGVSATHLDWTMVPYVRKSFYKHYIDGLKYCEGFTPVNEPNKPIAELSIVEGSWYTPDIYDKAYQYAIDMTKKELQQAVEGMYHNLNTLQSRSGNQLPFTSINYGTCTLPEGRMVIKALLEGSIKGVGKFHKTPIFPCGIFQVMSGVNKEPGTPNYDLYRLALKSTAKRLYPNYANVDWSGNAGYDPKDPTTYFSTMGCRTANGFDINAEPGVNPQRKDGRGNICPVTIILPTLAMEVKENCERCFYPDGYKKEILIDGFINRLDKKIDEAKDMLIERFNYICSQDPSSAKFMWENGTMLGYKPEEGIFSAMKHGTLALGQIGLAETLQILIREDHTTDKGMKLAKQIEELFSKRCKEYKERYKLNFGVYYTPAENLCYTAMKKFQEKYGTIKNVSDKEFFTNSIHVPVWKEIDPFTKIDIESQLTGYSSAGCITYVELDSGILNNIDALEQIVNYAMDHDIPYFALNIPNDLCLNCGYTGEINDKCPMCGGDKIQRLRRVTGYLTGDYKTAFNLGKQQETEMRFKHSTLLRGYR